MIFPRKLFKTLKNHLRHDAITLITGARQVGKTTLMKQLKSTLDKEKKSTTFINLEILETLDILNRNPENIWQFAPKNSKKKQYVFIDEIQYLKNPSNFLKHLYDEYAGKLKLIVSGSSAFYIDQKFSDSLAGRKRLFILRSLDFSEFLVFKKINGLTKTKLLNPEKKKILKLYEEYMMFGGYPKVVLSPIKEKEEILREIVNSYLKKDMDEQGIKDPTHFLDFLRLLASQVGDLFNQHEVSLTLKIPLLKIKEFLYLLQKTFYIQSVRPFHGNMRKELTKMPKIYFLDSGIRNYLLKDFRSPQDRIDKGKMLEEAVFIEFTQKYPDDRSIQFWRTQNKNEVDFVIEEKKAYEVKYNARNFSKKKYQIWEENYPNIPLHPISFCNNEEKQALYPWGIGL